MGEGGVLKDTPPIARRVAASTLLLLTFLCFVASAQQLPNKIRGYKVHNIKASEVPAAQPVEPGVSAPEINLHGLEVVDYSLSGVTFKTPVTFGSVNGSGMVDFISFHDFRVNGIPVEIEEYTDKFSFESGQPIVLPNPVKVFIRTDRVMTVAWKEARDSRPQWTVTGRAFVFGKFRKYGFTFKRVIPVDVTFTIKNPLYKSENTGN